MRLITLVLTILLGANSFGQFSKKELINPELNTLTLKVRSDQQAAEVYVSLGTCSSAISATRPEITIRTTHIRKEIADSSGSGLTSDLNSNVKAQF